MESIRTHGRRKQDFLRALRAVLALAAVILVAQGCGEQADRSGREAISDTTAYQVALAIDDTTAVVEALDRFLGEYPESPFRAGAYSRLYSLMVAQDPTRAGTFLRDRLSTERDPASRGRLYYALYANARDYDPDQEGSAIEALASDPELMADVYNMVAWNLVERETRLDAAVRLAELGAARAPDSTARASILDTQGWAEFKRGNMDEAVALLEEAVSLDPGGEIQEHLAAAYDESGRDAQALDLYIELLRDQEDPAMRAAVERLAGKTGRPTREIFQQIDRAREEAALPAPDFTLNDYSGMPMSLSELRGKVVLLNFWHPT